jgi:hypothetical protein
MAAGGRVRHPQDFGSFGQAAEFSGFGEDLELEQPVHFCGMRKRDLQILTFISDFCKAKYGQQSV